jgi:transcription initiation factor TFIIIB Brf1 subunit/transcription initiation factor TFIIB
VPLLTQQLGLPRKVALTALLFLKRFYLSKSVLEADPARFMLTCIYLACKVSGMLCTGSAVLQTDV